MTYKQAVDRFVEMCNPFNDYWSMQLAWSTYVDGLCKDRDITQRQYERWCTPCTPETFKKFNHKFWDSKYDWR